MNKSLKWETCEYDYALPFPPLLSSPYSVSSPPTKLTFCQLLCLKSRQVRLGECFLKMDRSSRVLVKSFQLKSKVFNFVMPCKITWRTYNFIIVFCHNIRCIKYHNNKLLCLLTQHVGISINMDISGKLNILGGGTIILQKPNYSSFHTHCQLYYKESESWK